MIKSHELSHGPEKKLTPPSPAGLGRGYQNALTG